VLKKAKPWVYTKASKGKPWLEMLNKELGRSHAVIACITPENSEAPWLLFEAGAVWKAMNRHRVCPLLMDIQPQDLPEPLRQFQATLLTAAEVRKLVLDLNELLGSRKAKESAIAALFDENWPLLEVGIKRIHRLRLPASNAMLDRVIDAFSRYVGSHKRTDGSQVHFDGGYETHAVYSAATSVARKRLYIFGRKNRKLFDKDHRAFFAGLKERISNGFDLRILFLSPDAPASVLSSASTDKGFTNKLRGCLRIARNVLEDAGVPSWTVCRSYRVGRPKCVMVVDDAVLCSPIKIDKSGRVAPTTGTPFSIVNAQSGCGKGVLAEFLTQWKEGDPL
jgi:hypothetical protein